MSSQDTNGLIDPNESLINLDGNLVEYITVYVGEQLFGIPVTVVQDVFEVQSLTRVPLSVPEVRGVLNLRGRIVTAIDMRIRLGLPTNEEGASRMAVGIEEGGEAFGLMVDSVGEVLSLQAQDVERSPANLDPRWQQVSSGVHRLENDLMVVLDVSKALELQGASVAA
ncbi:Positive regulator of CheA protein activity (CheW) [Candidatus Phaeomarinobacter ectocarpi]|uniref:Positive regulator of CheA protein activity (CheW) n=1 Tax=Candidatus Phaeomarinibacter ectocarpi TaxID=1458461 RepID=X5MKS9_9HYPH|nr:chemotaxis protein CheW [Candidatus Phaeomarinobacter ectocarpi]CDO58860.1 Positive regulator of CheA protein activity (CheW) [Candidatus Phaeomarinobacter ectocarpi]